MSTLLEDELRAALKTTTLAEPARSLSASQLVEIAQRRRRSRRIVGNAVALLTVAAVGAAGWIAVDRPDSPEPGAAESPVTRQPVGLGPGCAGAFMAVTDVMGARWVPPDEGGEAHIDMAAGDTVVITAVNGRAANTYVVSQQLVVAAPGTQPEAPGGAAEDPANQLAASATSGGFVADGQPATLTWTPTKPGVYPLIEIQSLITNDDCTAPPPTEGPATMNAESDLATITVH